MKIRLIKDVRMEIGGKPEVCKAGSTIEIGRQTAQLWIRERRAESLEDTGKKVLLSDLVQRARKFWFCEDSPSLLVHDEKITRADIHRVGGPDPRIACDKCQWFEWISRIRGQNRFGGHSCREAKETSVLCAKRNDAWSHLHQCFLFAQGIDSTEKLNVPRCLMIQPKKGIAFIQTRNNDPHTQVFLRQMSQVCVWDAVSPGEVRNNARYDFAYVVNNGEPVVPPVQPTVMYGHDLWKRREERQALLNKIKPEILWTPFAASWKHHFCIPRGTEVRFRPVPASTFYTRPDLIHKEFDLLSIGATASPIYAPRKKLVDDLSGMRGDFAIKFHHAAGASRGKATGRNDGKVPYGSAWSRFLSKARYVIFGPIADEIQPVFFKYYEVLGSGAVPIMPRAPDLEKLGIVPWVHYIPLDEVWDEQGLKGDALVTLLAQYEKHFQTAVNAVQWFQSNADRLLFESMAYLVRDITQEQFPIRLP